MRPSCIRRGFTLVELLVVLVIITIVMSLMLPAMLRVRENANKVVCINNHKQIIHASLNYAHDNRDAWPYVNWLSQDHSVSFPGWLYDQNLSNATGGMYTGATTVRSGNLWRYLNYERIFRCPVEDVPPGTYGPCHNITSYGFNGALQGYGAGSGDGHVPFYKVHQFNPNSIVIWELDETYHGGANIYNDGSNYPFEGITRRHSGRSKRNYCDAIISSADGSVDVISTDDYNIEVNRNPSRLWCTPQ